MRRMRDEHGAVTGQERRQIQGVLKRKKTADRCAVVPKELQGSFGGLLTRGAPAKCSSLLVVPAHAHAHTHECTQFRTHAHTHDHAHALMHECVSVIVRVCMCAKLRALMRVRVSVRRHYQQATTLRRRPARQQATKRPLQLFWHHRTPVSSFLALQHTLNLPSLLTRHRTMLVTHPSQNVATRQASLTTGTVLSPWRTGAQENTALRAHLVGTEPGLHHLGSQQELWKPENTREPTGDHFIYGNLTKTGGKTGTQGRPIGNKRPEMQRIIAL